MVTSKAVSLRELADAARDLLQLAPEADAAVAGVTYDSRLVEPGDLFFCVPGVVSDGHLHATAAVSRGASALCVQRPLSLGVPEIVVADVRRAMPRLAAAYYGKPAASLEVLGVTGTNGKTTTAFLLEAILKAAGRTTGLIGTIETRIGSEVQPGIRTTPESVDLQRLFRQMKDNHVDAVAMEVTSHGLVLHRVDEVRFTAVGFTNLSQDHLDFHSTMEDYFAAKRSLFVPERADGGAVNVDDPYGRELIATAPIDSIGFGMSHEADVRAVDVKLEPSGMTMRITTPVGEVGVATGLVGNFNVSNCLAATALALQAGIDVETIATGLTGVRSVPGRFESVDRSQPFSVVVDYAHTPDSLDNVLRAARRMAETHGGRLICAFGCGGDRDRGKRPLMGAVVARLADVVIVTSDNPRSEDPEAIIAEVLEGVVAERPDGPDAALVDRRDAIFRAIAAAAPGDVVVIAGKGHESGQEFADRKIPFDDRRVSAEALAELGYAGGAE